MNSIEASGAIFGTISGLLAFIGRENSGIPLTAVSDLCGSILPFLLFNLSAHSYFRRRTMRRISVGWSVFG